VRVVILDLDHRFSDRQQVHRYPRVSLAVMASLDRGLVGGAFPDAFSQVQTPLCAATSAPIPSQNSQHTQSIGLLSLDFRGEYRRVSKWCFCPRIPALPVCTSHLLIASLSTFRCPQLIHLRNSLLEFLVLALLVTMSLCLRSPKH